MSSAANFKVDPRLASLLGENYRSTEAALKELVDNSWDADAETIRISLASPLSGDPIVVEDFGSGMTEAQVRDEYLKVASDRRARKGDRTTRFSRLVKGRKGIGKFAGLMIADTMRIETTARCVTTSFTISRLDISKAKEQDLESIRIPIETRPAPEGRHGTKIVLSEPNQSFELPKEDKLRALLIREYGRENGLTITVDGQPLQIEDLPGEHFKDQMDVEGAGTVQIDFKISTDSKPLKNAGIAIRVDGKIVGKPSFFGLDQDETIPPKLLRRIYGEVEAPCLSDSTTADWGDFVESSPAYQAVQRAVSRAAKEALTKTYRNEINLQSARLKKELHARLALLPENRRAYAQSALERLLAKFYEESEEKRMVVASVVLDAFEHDEYWLVLKDIKETSHEDVHALASALETFGLVDLARTARQVQSRLQLLDELDVLITKEDTQEMDVHKIFEKNLWILGMEYTLVFSNQTLNKALNEYLDKKYQGDRGNKRPDLFLGKRRTGSHLLIEFKKPSIVINRDHQNQATKYRDDLRPKYGDIHVLLIGKERSSRMSELVDPLGMETLSFTRIISDARTNLQWLLDELQHRP